MLSLSRLYLLPADGWLDDVPLMKFVISNFAPYSRLPMKFLQSLALDSKIVPILSAPNAALRDMNTTHVFFSSTRVLLANVSLHAFNLQEFCPSANHSATLEISTGPTVQNLWIIARTYTLSLPCLSLPPGKLRQLKQSMLSTNLMRIITTIT